MYTDYFGFGDDPFHTAADSRFYYSNPIYQEAYNALLYGIRQRKGFLVLTGEVGTGKTTLSRWLMQTIEDSVRFVYFFNTTLSFEEMLSYVCDDLRLPVTGKGRLPYIQAINSFLLAQSEEGGTGVFLIDEAQNLGDDFLEQLRLLSNLEKDGRKLLQIVLVGQPELEETLAQPQLWQLKQRIALRAHLERLNQREIEAYITHRLMTVGYTGPRIFSPPALRKIRGYSRGIPRIINVLCDNALLTAYNLSQREVSSDIIDTAAQTLNLEYDESFASGTTDKSEGLSEAISKTERLSRVSQTPEPPRPEWKNEVAQALDIERQSEPAAVEEVISLPFSPSAPVNSTLLPSTWKNAFRAYYKPGIVGVLIMALLGGAWMFVYEWNTWTKCPHAVKTKN